MKRWEEGEPGSIYLRVTPSIFIQLVNGHVASIKLGKYLLTEGSMCGNLLDRIQGGYRAGRLDLRIDMFRCPK